MNTLEISYDKHFLNITQESGAILRLETTASLSVTMSHEGVQGAVGIGVPAGGAVGQAVVKTGATDFATGWGNMIVDGGDFAGNLNDLGPVIAVTRPTIYRLAAGFTGGRGTILAVGDRLLVLPASAGVWSQHHFGVGGITGDAKRTYSGSVWSGWAVMGDIFWSNGIERSDSANRSVNDGETLNRSMPFRATAGTAGNPTSDQDYYFYKINGANSATGALLAIGQDRRLFIGTRAANVWTWQRIEGIPAGGTTGQVLRKVSNTDFDDAWQSLGTMAVQDAANVGITGGSVQLAPSNFQAQLDTATVYPINNFTNWQALLPFASVGWHDLTRFLRFQTCTTEVTDDLATWNTIATDRRLFSGVENQSVEVIGANAARQAIRWTFNPVDWTNVEWLILGINYSAGAPTVQITVESSANGTTWTTRHQSTTNSNARPVACRIGNWNGDTFCRVTIRRTIGTDVVRLSSLRLMTLRWGDQGRGKEAEMPFDWNEFGDITTLRNLVVNGQMQIRAAAGNTPWTVTESGGDLVFARNGVNQMRLTAAGNLIVRGTVTQNGVP